MQDDKEHPQEDEGSFADLFAQEGLAPPSLTPGQKVEARVTSIGQESVFIDVGAKSEGVIPRRELEDETGTLTVMVGDPVRAFFLGRDSQGLVFTTGVGSGAASAAELEQAWQTGIPVEGTVTGEVKGGFSVQVAGGRRAFCPFSQMDLRRVGEPAAYLGQRLAFMITNYGEGGRNIVLSRRPILEAERERQRQEARQTLEEGMTVRGRVTGSRPFGVFVEVAGIEGLIPASELSWDRRAAVASVLAEGQEVEVRILKLDWEANRFTFSLKQLAEDPWLTAAQGFAEGSWHDGVVARLTAFGAFVTLAPGVDGLVHISEMGQGRRINHPREVVQEGQEVRVRIKGVDGDSRRIALSLAEDEVKVKAREEADYQATLSEIRREAGPRLGTLGEKLAASLMGKTEGRKRR
ncbi:MAG: 30S ribosomal protein S1 [Thermodesulfobacteriota bacterium]